MSTRSVPGAARGRAFLVLNVALVLAGCGRISDDGGTGGSSDGGGDGGAPTGAGGELPGGGAGGTSAGGSAAGGSGTGAGGLNVEDLLPDEPSWEEFLEMYRLDAPFESDLPAPPDDYVPLLPVGEAGWRQSGVPFCSQLGDQRRAELWADADGVALLVSSCPIVLDTHCQSGAELWYNGGSGWTWLLGLSVETSGLTGVAGGELLVGGPGALVIGRDGVVRGQSPTGSGYTGALFGNGLGPAYALMTGPSSAEPNLAYLYRYDGADWTALATYPDGEYAWLGVGALTIAGETAYVAGSDIVARAELGADFAMLTDAPLGHHAAVGGLAKDDVWVADYYGAVRHYDGESWTTIGATDGVVVRLLPIEGNMYFVTDHEFGRLTATDIEVIETIQGGTFRGMAGVSESEIFLSLSDFDLHETSCAGQQVFVYDGEEFHSF